MTTAVLPSHDVNHQVFVENLFTGEHWLYNVIVQVEAVSSSLASTGHVKRIVSHSSPLPSSSGLEIIPYMIPPLMDLQIYGAHDFLLSEFPSTETILHIQDYCQQGGAWYYQPTVATNDLQILRNAIDATRTFLRNHNEANRCIGLHLEGPWISPAKRGAHILQHVHSPTLEEVKELLDYGEGVISMITLAPEVLQDDRILNFIDDRGITISAGHSDMTFEFAMDQFSQINASTQQPRIRTATHLYNAMSVFQHRAPGMVGAIWTHPSIRSSIVCDGYHVDFAAVALAKRLMGPRLFCITDAVTPTNQGAYQHYLNGDKYESQGILSGSALTMLKAMDNLVDKVQVELGEAIRMCSLYPAQVINKQYSGRIFSPAAAENQQNTHSTEELGAVLCLDHHRKYSRFL